MKVKTCNQSSGGNDKRREGLLDLIDSSFGRLAVDAVGAIVMSSYSCVMENAMLRPR